jgi:hypothetical protein
MKKVLLGIFGGLIISFLIYTIWVAYFADHGKSKTTVNSSENMPTQAPSPQAMMTERESEEAYLRSINTDRFDKRGMNHEEAHILASKLLKLGNRDWDQRYYDDACRSYLKAIYFYRNYRVRGDEDYVADLTKAIIDKCSFYLK